MIEVAPESFPPAARYLLLEDQSFMFAKPLVGLDGSRKSERTLAWARLFSLSGKVWLVRAAESSDLRQAQAYLSPIAASFTPDASTITRRGTLEGLLLQGAAELGADLILIAVHQASLRTVEYLIAHSDVPVLVVPSWNGGAAEAKLKTIVLPLDGSELSEMILPIARSINRIHKSRFILIRILTRSETNRRNYSTIDKSLIKLASELEECGVDSRIITGSGNIEDGIVRAADEEKADMILMATHGDRGLRRVLFGTMARKVIGASPVPVLIAQAGALAKFAGQ